MDDKELLERLVDTMIKIVNRYNDDGGIMRAVDRSGFDITSALIDAKETLDCLP